MADLGLIAGVVGVVLAIAGNFLPEQVQPWILLSAGALLTVRAITFPWATEATTRWPGFVGKWAKLKTDYPKLTWPYVAVANQISRHAILTGLVLFVAVFLLLRFVAFGTVRLDGKSLEPAFPEDNIKLRITGLLREHPKILSVEVEPEDGSGSNIETINEGFSKGELSIDLPAGLAPGRYNLVITGPLSLPLLRNQAVAQLSILGTPEISKVEPPAGFVGFGTPGTRLVISGKNFDPRNNGTGNQVKIGGARAGSVNAGTSVDCAAAKDPCIVTSVPGEAPDGDVDLTVEAGPSSAARISNAWRFHVLGSPQVNRQALLDQRAFPGSLIDIRGTDFYPAIDTNMMTVSIGGERATIVSASQTHLRVKVPASAKPGALPVRVWTRARGGSADDSGTILILGPPRITDVRPGKAHAGEQIEIVGENFDTANPGNNVVTVGDASAQIVGAHQDPDHTVLTIVVPGLAQDKNITVTTPAGQDSSDAFQVEPLIDNIVPKRAYVGNDIAIEGRGLFRDATALAFNNQPMQPKGFKKTPTGQILRFELPQAAETGVITVRQGSGVTAKSKDELVIDRFDELKKNLPLSSPVVRLTTGKGVVGLSAQCDQGLVITGDLPGLPNKAPAGKCPIDVDVDAKTNLAYVANSGETKEHGISEIDVSNPFYPVHKGFIDSGGANPTRVKLMYGGKIVVAASGGVFRGNANGGLAPTGVTGNVLKLIGDPVEGQFVAAIMQDGRIAMFYPEGPPKVSAPFGEMPSAALAGNRIYVVHYGSDSIAWFDPKDPSKVEQKSLSKGARPFDLAINANQVWVTETGLKQVAVMDTGSQSISEIELSFMPTLIAFSPDGCVAVVYGKDDGEFAKLDPKRRSMFDLVQRLPQPPQVIGLRIDLRQELYFVLPDGKMQGAYYASCPLP